MAIIYLATNQKNGKRYVGFTTQSLHRRRYQHWYDATRKDRKIDTYFYRAIRKYGIDSFTFEIIKEGDPKELLDECEPKLIVEYQSTDRRYGYNICSGGQGRVGCVPWNKGIPRTPEVREKLRLAHTGSKQSLETIAKRVSKTRGQKRSEKTKRIMAGEWLITDPSGHSQNVANLLRFCLDNALDMSCMLYVANGKRKHHKGYACKRTKLSPQSRLKSPPSHLI